MSEYTYVVSLHYLDETDNDNPKLIQQRLAAYGDLTDYYFRDYLHMNLDEIITTFRRHQKEENANDHAG